MSLTKWKRNLAKQTAKANNLKAKLEEIVDNRKELREANSKLAGQVESLKGTVATLEADNKTLKDRLVAIEEA